MKIIWHQRKSDMPKVLSVPAGELHFYHYHCRKSPSRDYVEVRGVPMTFHVQFNTNHINGGAIINFKNGAQNFSEKDILDFKYYMETARYHSMTILEN